MKTSKRSVSSLLADTFTANRYQYGVLICIRCHDYRRQDVVLGAALLFIIPCHLFVAYVIELAAAQQALSSIKSAGKKRSGTATPGGSYIPTDDELKKFQSTWKMLAWIHGINASLCLLITSIVVYFYIHHPLIGTLSEVHAIIVWLKTASYAFTNRDLRHAYLHPSKRSEDAVPEIYDQCPYPQNITLGNLTYFWWAPTLVYQPVYPRTRKIRWEFVGKRVAEVFVLNAFMWIASAQYAAPVLRNSLQDLASLNLFSIIERLMKLSTISLVIWLAGFFALFQSFLNALAEVMKFGDREFYTDWWNSPSVGVYWRTWNKPVYQYMKRHVFSPLIGRGWSTRNASTAVFVFSAVLHELLVGIPTHNVIGTSESSFWMTVLLTVCRSCFHWNDCATALDFHHGAAGKDGIDQWQNNRKLYFLDFVHAYWATTSSTLVLLCLAGKVRNC